MRIVLRVLQTRFGIAAILAVLVLAVVATFKGVAGSRPVADYAPPVGPSQTVSVEPGGGDDGLAYPNGGSALASPSLDPPAAAMATALARDFAAAWLNHKGVTAAQWRAGLQPHATAALLERLSGVDPVTVPADRTTGDVTLAVRDPALVEATVPVDPGTLTLRLIASGNRWKVDGVSWDRTP